MARFDGGWIRIERRLADEDIAQRGLFTLGVWLKLLLIANWKESKAFFGGEKITLKPGQLITGLRELSPDMEEDPHLNKIRSALDYLLLTNRIEQVSNNRGRLITIVNYSKYQLVDTDKLQAEHKLSTNAPQLSEQVTRKKTNTVSGFDLEEAYSRYPRKQGKSPGMKRLAPQIKTEADYNDLLTAIHNYSLCEDVKRGFVKLFSTFAGEWRDWVDSSTGKLAAPKVEEFRL